MTRDRSLETSVLLQDILVVLVAMLLSRSAHAALVAMVPTLKPPVAAGEYAHLLLVFLPTWMFAAERLGIHRLQTVTGEKLEIVRRVILTQAWGVAAIGLILTFAQVSLNRSLIIVFLVLSTALLLAAKAVQRPWLARRRGQSRVLLIGEASPEDMAREFERLRGRHVERWTGSDPVALEARFRAGTIDEVVLVGRCPPEQMLAFVGRVRGGGIARVPAAAAAEPQSLPLPPPDIETVGNKRLRRLPAAQARGPGAGRQGGRRSRAGGAADRPVLADHAARPRSSCWSASDGRCCTCSAAAACTVIRSRC